MSKKRTTNRVNFGQRALAALPIPAKSRVYVFDTKVPGLALCITPGGARSYYLYRWVKGKPQRLRIAAFGEISVEQARRRAAALNNEIAAGENPLAKKRATRGCVTFGELFAHWLDVHAKPRKRTWAEDERIFKRQLQSWKARRVDEITAADAVKLHAHVGKSAGKIQANRVIALCRTVFNFAIRNGLQRPNPCGAVQMFRETSRDRFLGADELRRFLVALRDDPSALFRDYFSLALMTGARRGNLQAMRWADLDLDRGVWRIPAEQSKNAEVMTAILPVPAVVILRERKDVNGCAWVFPGAGKTGHITEHKSAWKRIIERADLADVRPHDLRRTLGSWQAMRGVPLLQIGKSLGHRSIQSTEIYARLQMDTVREHVEGAVSAMFGADDATQG